MVTAIRRLFWLAVVGGAGYAGWSAWQRRSPATVSTPPNTAPNAPRPAASAGNTAPAFTVLDGTVPDDTVPDDKVLQDALDDPVALWVAAIDGGCPDGYPIKANTNSGIYHVPGGRFYERTRAERCYAHTADAEADGYRRAKA